MQDSNGKRRRRHRSHRKSRRKIKLALIVVAVWIVVSVGLIYYLQKPPSDGPTSFEGQ